MAEHYWTVGHDYDWHTPAELSVYGISYATEELAVEAARRLLRCAAWMGYGNKPTHINYTSGYGGRKIIAEWSHEWGRTMDRICSFTEGRDGNTVTLNYMLESREEHLRTHTRKVEHDGEVYTHEFSELECGPWGPLLGRAYGEEWQRLGGRLYAYIGCAEITTELPELSNLG